MKKRLLCTELPLPHRPAILSEREAHHAVRVLRLRDGDSVEALDGNGKSAFSILKIHGGLPRLEYLEAKAPLDSVACTHPLILEMAVLKGTAMEWCIEKAVELGVKKFVPLITDHTVVQIKAKGPEAFRDRWTKIAESALKQSGRLDRMEIQLPLSLENLLSHPLDLESVRIWCDEGAEKETPFLLNCLNNTLPKEGHTHILIGPEGGWSNNERNQLIHLAQIHKNCQRVSLGPLVLRAETAALFAVSVASAFYRAQ